MVALHMVASYDEASSPFHAACASLAILQRIAGSFEIILRADRLAPGLISIPP